MKEPVGVEPAAVESLTAVPVGVSAACLDGEEDLRGVVPDGSCRAEGIFGPLRLLPGRVCERGVARDEAADAGGREVGGGRN